MSQPTFTLRTPDPAADAQRRVSLRRMRTLAVGLLVLAGVVFLATLHRSGWLGYVNAAAEAAMVGAIADWFAVTALFKHPMGVPIPHTALIPKRKDDLGRSLEQFVTDNFLQEDILRDRVAHAQVSQRLGQWLSDEGNTQRVADELAELLRIGLAKVTDQHIAEFVTAGLVPRFRQEPISPLLGGMLSELVADDLHRGVVDLAVVELRGWLIANERTFTEVLVERAPWWAPQRLNETVAGKLHAESINWLADIARTPDHRARLALDSLLRKLSDDLLTDPATQARTEALKDRLLDHPQVVATGISIWHALQHAVLDSLGRADGAVRRRLLIELSGFAQRLRAEPELRAWLDRLMADAVVFVVDRYGDELTAVITHTVQRWDGKEAARRIELHVGRDLQFIRINGTIVGGLVGLLIHAVSQWLGA